MPLDTFGVSSEDEMLEYIDKVFREAQAWRYTAQRLDEAHEYVRKYCMKDGWGRNVWHSILEDAIKMRNERNA